MSLAGSLDLSAAHRLFSVQCFNETWKLIDQHDRTPIDNATMLLRSAASLWHWTQRTDCTGRNLSIGYWQMSRVLAISGHGQLARQFGTLCLESAPEDDSFCRAYAFECLARAASVLQEYDEVTRCVSQATIFATLVEDEQDREMLLVDLRTIAGDQA